MPVPVKWRPCEKASLPFCTADTLPTVRFNSPTTGRSGSRLPGWESKGRTVCTRRWSESYRRLRSKRKINDLTAANRGAGRLELSVLPIGRRAGNDSPGWLRNAVVAHIDAKRALFLNSDCLPDEDFVEAHLRLPGCDVLLYSYRRTYPQSKLFPFRDAVAYHAIRRHSVPELTAAFASPGAVSCQAISDFAFSAPSRLLREVVRASN